MLLCFLQLPDFQRESFHIKDKYFEIGFDFNSHKMVFKFNDGKTEFIELQAGTIISYYKEIKQKLRNLGCEINIWPVPVEAANMLKNSGRLY